MIIAGLVLTGIAALIHVYIFYLESIVWTNEKTRKIFGVESVEEAEITKPLAFNQGFYNLFLAIAIAVGTVFWTRGCTSVGATLVFTGAGSMVAAGLVLLISSPDKASAALKQLAPPLLGIICLAVGLAVA
ncbi:DUF1304 domain-containing protein [Mycobacterium sp. CBMA271]|uniref:DUF1304 domain-containing protein n=1 Tax=unclassified Mycobacteroides TaxID=2618759 RepID=UPI0012DBFD2C|nr:MULTISPECIES: DUF1304 domain-containing protein [unclassified Mycobacteroides]MUM18117.1 hypothetical protein [Mycobacteroides sp. CBMA 326]MUM23398.1 DUF1304 domain-containing protein [Mycobacteroides sp. CBMA 271]